MMGASPTRWNYPWSEETHRPNLDAMTKGACVKRPTTALASKRAPLDHTGGIQVHPACYDNRPAVGQPDARPLPRRDPRRTRASRGLIGVGRAGPRGASHQTCGSGDAVERSWSRGKDSTISPRTPNWTVLAKISAGSRACAPSMYPARQAPSLRLSEGPTPMNEFDARFVIAGHVDRLGLTPRGEPGSPVPHPQPT